MVTFLLMVNKHLVNTYYVPDLSLPWKYRTINPLPSLEGLSGYWKCEGQTVFHPPGPGESTRIGVRVSCKLWYTVSEIRF